MSDAREPTRRTALETRVSKVDVADFGRPVTAGATVGEFLRSLPAFLGARDLRALAGRIGAAAHAGRPVVVGLGAHVIKVGASPYLIDLIDRGVVTAIALNGAGIIHDYEIARAGRTSEDVDATLGDGSFGSTHETGTFLNRAIAAGAHAGVGLGEAVARAMADADLPHATSSLLVAAHRNHIPATVHVAIGTDVIHIHPEVDGAAIGRATFEDFERFCRVVGDLEGGVYLNLGSAVLLPEIFLKAVTRARGHGRPLADITTADLDFRSHYRPLTNVVRRPTREGGRGFALTGHHELMIPLLAAAVLEELAAHDRP